MKQWQFDRRWGLVVSLVEFATFGRVTRSVTEDFQNTKWRIRPAEFTSPKDLPPLNVCEKRPRKTRFVIYAILDNRQEERQEERGLLPGVYLPRCLWCSSPFTTLRLMVISMRSSRVIGRVDWTGGIFDQKLFFYLFIVAVDIFIFRWKNSFPRCVTPGLSRKRETVDIQLSYLNLVNLASLRIFSEIFYPP